MSKNTVPVSVVLLKANGLMTNFLTDLLQTVGL